MKAYKYKLYKNKYNDKLSELITYCGYLYNHCIALHKRYYRRYKKLLNMYQLQKHLTRLKKIEKYSYLKEVPIDALQEVTERIDKGYKLFFRNLKQGIKSRPPKFKKSKIYKSLILKKAGFKVLESNKIKIKDRIYKYSKSQEILGKIKRISINRNNLNEYYIVIITDYVDEKFIEKTGKSVGYDFGLKTFLTSSDYEDIISPLYLLENINKLRKLNRKLSNKKKGSNHYKKAKLKLAKLHESIYNKRLDFHNKLALTLVKKYDNFFFENLDLQAISKRFGRKIYDLGFYQFLQILKNKCYQYNKNIYFINRYFPSSKTCSKCGFINHDLQLKDREWTCSACSTHHDRDRNASFNIYKEGASSFKIANCIDAISV